MQRLFGPYYYSKHKWDNDLLNIQGTIKAGAAQQQKATSLAKAAT